MFKMLDLFCLDAMSEAPLITRNLDQVLEKIAVAAEVAGRSTEEIQLVGVTKYVNTDVARMLFEAGCSTLGESRPQELWRKSDCLDTLSVNWHLIGHLQTNKVRRTLPQVALIHSVDSVRLLEAIEKEAVRLSQRIRVLLEVNVSGDISKHGFLPTAAERLIPKLANYPHVQVCGLMTMASLRGDTAQARSDFSRLRNLRDRWQLDCPPGVSLQELSMGMTRDFEQAIQEGATMVRVGSGLFEGLKSNRD